MHETYKKWLNDDKPKVICQCGCNQEIIITRYHKHDGIPKYIRGHQNRGKHFTKEHKQKLKDNHADISGENSPMFGKHHTEETKRKMRDAKLGKHLTKETKQKLRESNLGKQHTEETKQKMRNNSARFGIPPSSKTSHGERNYYESPLQGKVCFRSTYELAYAKYLDENNILWMYEIETFDLGNNTYTPDFFLLREEKFIEIKGYMRKNAQEKINKFLEQYPWNLEILYKEDLIKLGIEL